MNDCLWTYHQCAILILVYLIFILMFVVMPGALLFKVYIVHMKIEVSNRGGLLGVTTLTLLTSLKYKFSLRRAELFSLC